MKYEECWLHTLGSKNKHGKLHLNRYLAMTQNGFMISSVCGLLTQEDDWVAWLSGQDRTNDPSRDVSVPFHFNHINLSCDLSEWNTPSPPGGTIWVSKEGEAPWLVGAGAGLELWPQCSISSGELLQLEPDQQTRQIPSIMYYIDVYVGYVGSVC